MKKDLVIIGGGPAGLAAALSAKAAGCLDILILERDRELGGILNQCIHNGFGLHTFQEELTGPEYAHRYVHMVEEQNIAYMRNTMVVDIRRGEGIEKIVTAMNREEGLFEVHAGAVILAMGCRERPRGALNTPGFRPAGIYCAGTAQYFVNVEGRMPGKEIVILGSGDIGLIMARRLTLEGAKVKAVAEIMPHSGGLQRNIVQCLEDYNIPLKLSHTVVDIQGKERVAGVTLAKVDEQLKPIPGTEEQIACDTLLLSVGLIPENELSMALGVEMDLVSSGPVVNENLETNVEGVFACGNVLHVHDLVDYVSKEAEQAGASAAAFIQGRSPDIRMGRKDGIALPKGSPDVSKRSHSPDVSKGFDNPDVSKGSDNPDVSRQSESREELGGSELVCIRCPIGCTMSVKQEGGGFQISGNRCQRGQQYAIKELTAPTRVLTSVIRVRKGSGRVIPVKSRQEIPKNKMMDCMLEIKKIQVALPVRLGEVLIQNVAETGVEIVATKDLLY